MIYFIIYLLIGFVPTIIFTSTDMVYYRRYTPEKAFVFTGYKFYILFGITFFIMWSVYPLAFLLYLVQSRKLKREMIK
jgi:hypothetical protein